MCLATILSSTPLFDVILAVWKLKKKRFDYNNKTNTLQEKI